MRFFGLTAIGFAAALFAVGCGSDGNPFVTDSPDISGRPPQEADGFTDIVEVYANLKPDEKAVFIIRHSERTDDTGPKGQLTLNGFNYAKDLGNRA